MELKSKKTNNCIFIFFSASFLVLLLISGCSSSGSSVRYGNTDGTNEEVKEPTKIIPNPELEHRNYISSNKIKEIDKVEFEYDRDGKLFNGKKLSSAHYNSKGFPTETVTFNSDGKIKYKYSYIFNEQGIRTKTIRLNSNGNQNGKYSYKYDRYGNKIESRRFDIQGNLEKIYKYEYDEGRLINEIWYDKSSEPEYNIEYEYDGEGRKEIVRTYDGDGELLYKYKFRYDSSDNIIEETKFDESGMKIGIIQYIYKYY